MNNLKDVHSCYNPSNANWGKFIECWIERTKNDRGARILALGTKSSVGLSSPKEILSRSITDFYQAYDELGGIYASIEDTEAIGFYHPSDHKVVQEFDAEFVEHEKQFAMEVSDFEYYIYGIDQDTSVSRFEHLEKSIVVGKHGFSRHELILVYPNSTTSDMELETAIISNSYEFRAPSFAEMMRQMSFIEVTETNLLPPVEQEKIDLSCGSLITMENIWWN